MHFRYVLIIREAMFYSPHKLEARDLTRSVAAGRRSAALRAARAAWTRDRLGSLDGADGFGVSGS